MLINKPKGQRPTKPRKPSEPRKIMEGITCHSVYLETISIKDFERKAIELKCEARELYLDISLDHGYDGPEINMEFIRPYFEIPNPNYTKECVKYTHQLKKYKEKMEKYNKKVEPWIAWDSQEEERIKQAQERKDLVEFERLKKKFTTI